MNLRQEDHVMILSKEHIPWRCAGNKTNTKLEASPIPGGSTLSISCKSLDGEGKKQFTIFFSDSVIAVKASNEVKACTKSMALNRYLDASFGGSRTSQSMSHKPLIVAKP